MPELPEVERVRRTLEPHLVGSRVSGLWIYRADVITGIALGFDLMHGGTIDRLERRGKQLAMITTDTRAVVVHLGMSGQLFVEPGVGPPEGGGAGHRHVVWQIENTTTREFHRMIFRDPRRFGGLWTFRDSAVVLRDHWADLGPDALELTAAHLRAACAGTKRAIKAVLLDQSVVAGIGNIYADEALFMAGVSPRRAASRLTTEELDRLAVSIRKVLVRAIKAGGSTLRDFRDGNGEEGSYRSQHAVYGRGGEPCLTCETVLRSAAVGQRTTVWCPTCQADGARRSTSRAAPQAPRKRRSP